ncbi:signal peptidase II [Candidatus Woesearchaeota archaeon]|nr:signal peptidase II [Candidatus Woesearchaeota archaeon]
MKKWILTFLVVILDQLTKSYSNLIDFDFWLLSIRQIKNTGAGFGILKDYRFLLIFISIIVMFIAIYYLINAKNKYSIYGLSFILGGTIGNLIDRIFFGYVRDFIDFGFWPAFNLADSFITIGGIILVYLLITDKI